MSDVTLELGHRALALQLADLVRDARLLIGWSQRELASRASTSQPTISRLETGQTAPLDLAVVERVLVALGFRARLELDDRHLGDRRRQRDPVHARLTGTIARRLERCGWQVATEVPIGDGAPRGWIDLLAFRAADRALLVEETKGDIPDFGALQRSVAFYEREAPFAARRLGWRPGAAAVLVVGLDSVALGRRLMDNRELAVRAFPAPLAAFSAWLRDPHEPPPRGWAIAMCDPASRAAEWLRPTPLTSRRRPAYEDYRTAAARPAGSRRDSGA